MVSPRRSSRARNPQSTTTAPGQPNSSSSSSATSSRLDRSANSTQKPSPRDSAAPQSHNSGSRDPSSLPPPRRTRSSQEETKVEPVLPVEDVEEEDGDNDVTRCVCGSEVYPGSPFVKERAKERSASKGRDPALGPDCVFIQCDNCQVWQHGPCVGMPDDSDADSVEYFCEQCKPELHKVSRNSSGQQYSRYLPLKERLPSTNSSTPSIDDMKAKPKETRTTRVKTESTAGKRRSTMNSRDAAYDEGEQLRIALEQSKTENVPSASDRKKRSREDSEEQIEPTKRRRTSDSSPTPRSSQTISREASISPNNSTSAQHKSVRGPAARNRAAKELRDREAAREEERQNAANRRRARSERRRGDDPPEEEEEEEEEQEATPDAPPVSTTTTSKTSHHPPPPSTKQPPKPKGGRPPARRGRLGRNQYTKDRSSPTAGAASKSPNDASLENESPRVNHQSNASGGGNLNGEIGKTGAKHKTINPHRTSMTDLKRRAGAILDFITRAQVELANDHLGGGGTTQSRGGNIPAVSSSAPQKSASLHPGNGAVKAAAQNHIDSGGGGNDNNFSTINNVPLSDKNPSPPSSLSSLTQNGEVNPRTHNNVEAPTTNEADPNPNSHNPKNPVHNNTNIDNNNNNKHSGEDVITDEWLARFEKLNGVEMMDVLTTKLIRWQAEYGKLER